MERQGTVFCNLYGVQKTLTISQLCRRQSLYRIFCYF